MSLEVPGPPRTWRGQPVTAVRCDRAAVIGDLHGEAALLDALLRQLGDRTLITVGDVCDRGPDTRGVLERLVDRGAVGVFGNHDLWLATWAAGEGFDPLALGIGGETTLASYGATLPDPDPAVVPAAHRDWLLSLSIALDLTVADTRWWVVHAGIPSDASFEGLTAAEIVPSLARTRAADLLWRANDPEAMVPLDRPVIMGHRPGRAPRDTGEVLAIDTGAGKPGGRLTAVLLPERRFVTVG